LNIPGEHLSSNQWRINQVANQAHALGPQKDPGHFCQAKNTHASYSDLSLSSESLSLSKGFSSECEAKMTSSASLLSSVISKIAFKNESEFSACLARCPRAGFF